MQVRIAEAIYEIPGPQRQMAADLVMGVLQEQRENRDGLLLYSRIADELGQHVNALQVLLTLVVTDQQHPILRFGTYTPSTFWTDSLAFVRMPVTGPVCLLTDTRTLLPPKCSLI